MKIIILGATGTIGSVVANELGKRHEIIAAGSKSGDVRVDMSSADSIEKMFKTVGPFDALVSAAGHAFWGDFSKASEEDLYKGLRGKLMGQVNLVRIGMHKINDRGSFTLTSGILGDRPVLTGVNSSMANGALNAFAMAAAIELPRGIRINTVSPGLVEESANDYGDIFKGHIPVSMDRVAKAYAESVEGKMTGETIKVY